MGAVLRRLPKDVVLQGKTTWQERAPKASTVARYTAALKRAGAKFRAGVARSVRTGGDTPRTVGTPSSQLTAQRLGRGQPASGQLGSLGGLRSPHERGRARQQWRHCHRIQSAGHPQHARCARYVSFFASRALSNAPLQTGLEYSQNGSDIMGLGQCLPFCRR